MRAASRRREGRVRAPGALLAVATGLALLGSAPAATAQATDWKQIPKPPLRPFEPQQPRRLALPNGLVVFLQEDHELPLVAGYVRVRGGSRDEPSAKVGLVGLYGLVWRTGGTTTRTGDELDDVLEQRAAKVETSGGQDATFLSWNCLKEDLPDVLGVVDELLRKPAFREDKLEIAKQRLFTVISRRNDDPDAIVEREARKLGYGADSPYSRHSEYATVAAVTRQDLLDWHARSLQPGNVILGVAGDFDGKALEAELRRRFGGWPRGTPAPRTPPPVAETRPGVYFVAKEDVNQSNIAMVHLGITRDNPDFYAVEVMNQMFGGGFSGRLFTNVRSRKGLAYSVGGGVGAEMDHPGLFEVWTATKSGSTAAAIEALYEEIDALIKTPPSAEELASAKDKILNSFVFNFDSKEKVLLEQMVYEFYGYPLDSLARYRREIEKVTAQDVERVARRYVHKDRVALLVVGKADEFDRPLSAFGPVVTLDVAIPGSPSGAAASPGE